MKSLFVWRGWALLAALSMADLARAETIISMSPARIVEGDVGSLAVQVPVYLSAAAAVPVTVAWATEDGTAVALSDYVAGGGTLTFAPGETYKIISVSVLGDTTDELDEQFSVTLASPTAAVIGTIRARVLIQNDEPITLFALPEQFTLQENAGPETALPKARVANPRVGKFATLTLISGTATAGADLLLQTPTLGLGSLNPALPVRGINDLLPEANESFSLRATSADVSVRQVPNRVAASIPISQLPSSLSLNGNLMTATDGSIVKILRRTGNLWSEEATLDGTTQGGVYAATVDQDLIAADFRNSGVKVFSQVNGIWTQQAHIPRVTNPADQRRIVVLNDDLLAVGDPAATGQTTTSGEIRLYERHLGGVDAWGLRQVITPPVVQPDFGSSVSVWGSLMAVGSPNSYMVAIYRRDRTTAQWTRVKEFSRQDYTVFGTSCAINGETVAIPSSYYGTFTSRKTDATGSQWSELGSVSLASLSYATRCAFHGNVLGLNDGYGAMELFASGVDGVWSDAGIIAAPSGQRGSIGSFAFDRDTVVLPDEVDSSFGLRIYQPGVSSGTVVDDDSVEITVSSPSFQEDTPYYNTGFHVTLSRAMEVPVSVLVTTLDGTGTAGLDCEWFSSWVTISAGYTQIFVPLTLYQDSLTEGPETIFLSLDEPSIGTVGPPGVLTITDPPPPPLPVLSINNSAFSVVEGNTGTTQIQVDLSLNKPVPAGTSFRWTLESGSAIEGEDFPATSQVVAIPTGANSVSIQIPVTTDTICEAAESFTVRLSDPVLITLVSPPTTTITITNDDVGIPQPDTYSVVQGTVLAGVNVRSNDCSSRSVSLAQNVAHGTLVLNSSGAFVYSPLTNFMGADSFSYNGGGSGSNGIPSGTDLVTPTTVFRWLHPLDGVDPATIRPDWNTGWFTGVWDDTTTDWHNGTGLMGYGAISTATGTINPDTDIGMAVIAGNRKTVYYRTQFQVPQGQSGLYDLDLSLSRDDAAIVYLNGVEVVRSYESGTTTFATAADTFGLLVNVATGTANEGTPVLHQLTGINLVAGTNTLAISVHNSINSTDSGVKVFFLRVMSGGTPPPAIPVTLTVTDAHVPPVLEADTYTMLEDASLDTQAAGTPSLWANDSLQDPATGEAYDPILEVASEAATNGTVALDGATGHFTFTPAANFSGTASFSYKVRDKDGWSAPTLVSINVAEDFPITPLVRLNPLGSGLFRSVSNLTFPSSSSGDAALSLKAGQTISLRASLPGTLGQLEVRGLDGAPLSGGSTAPNRLDNVPIPVDGTYVLVAGQAAGGNVGSLTILVNGGLPNQPTSLATRYDLETTIPFGSPRAAVAATMPSTLAIPHFYRFSGLAGEKVQLYLQSTSAQSFNLLNENNTVLANSVVSSSSSAASGLALTLPVTATYQVRVNALNGADYTLQLYHAASTHESAPAGTSLVNRGAGYLAGLGVIETGITFAAFGDYGFNNANEASVATLVKSWNPDFIIALGDHNYSGIVSVGAVSWTNVIGNYYGDFIKGRADARYPEQTSLTQRFFPAPGNHDSGPDSGNGGELSGYFDYFYSNPGASPRLPDGVYETMLSYYKMNWGNMEFYFLDSDNAVVNPSAASAQRTWLKAQLAASTAQWKFAAWHHPPYSSGSVHGSQAAMQWGADFQGLTAIFCGHEHIYERLEIGNGVTQFITGLGGASRYGIATPLPQSQFRYNSNWGAMKISAGSAGVGFEFRSVGVAGGTVTDSYSIGSPPGSAVPSGTDSWTVLVHPGQRLHLTTTTNAPPAPLTNPVNPKLTLEDTNGTVMASDSNSAPDALNAKLDYTVPDLPGCPPAGCLWRIKVANENAGSGEYTLHLAPPTPAESYDLWVRSAVPSGARDITDDPDGDGSPNLMEYLAGTNPVSPEPLPPLTISGSNNATGAILQLNLPLDWTRPVKATLQSSVDLSAGSWQTEASKSPGVPWAAVPPAQAPIAIPGEVLSLPLSVHERKFYRLEFTLE